MAHVTVGELVIMGPESKRRGRPGLAVEGLEAAPFRGMVGAGEDSTAAYDGAGARLAFGAALPGWTFGPQGSPKFWHCLHLSWFDEFLSCGSHCCGLDSKSEPEKRGRQCGLKLNGALEGPLALTFLLLQDSHFSLGRFELGGGGLAAGRKGAAEAGIIIFSVGAQTTTSGRYAEG
jgi:hypothetical protein